MNRKCGTCVFGQFVDTQSVNCHGNPPTMFLMPVPPGPLSNGQPQIAVQKMRPRMGNDERGCHLWEPKVAEVQPVRAGGVVLR